MAIAKQFEFFIYGRGLLTDPTLPVTQSNMTYTLDAFHVNGNAFNLTLLTANGVKTALLAAVGAAIVKAASIPTTAVDTGIYIKKQFEYQFDGRGVLIDVTDPLDTGNVNFIFDILSVNGVSYKMSTFTSTEINPLVAAVKTAVTVTNVIPGLFAATVTAAATINNQPFGTADVVTATVKDQNGTLMQGVTVAFARTGGTATTPTVAASAVSNSSGIATSNIGAASTGTVIGTATVAGITAPATWTATFAAPQSVVTAAVVAAGGSGYAIGNTITLANGVILTVATLSTTAVATVTVSNGGSVATASKPANPVAQVSSNGGGTGATFTLTWNP